VLTQDDVNHSEYVMLLIELLITYLINMNNRCDDTDRVKEKCSDKHLSQCYFVDQKF